MHTKYYNKHNMEVPSTTTILKVLNKPGLVHWANSLGFKKASYNKELNRTAAVGTLVHAYIEENMKSRLFRDLKKALNLDDKSANEVLTSYSAFKLWKKHNKHNLKIIESELQLVSNEYNYGGTIDFIAELEGEKYIIDFKTSSKVHPTMFLQLAAYAKMAKENGYNIQRVAILRLDKKSGIYEFVTMNVKKTEEYFDVFLLLLQTYRRWTLINEKDWNIDNVF